MLLNERKERRYFFFLTVFFVTALFPAYYMPLFDSVEGTYIETAREMLLSGNWLLPQLSGVSELDHPPLVYWLAAAGMKFFGVSVFGARFFFVVASVVTLVFTRKTAYLLTRDDSAADCTVYATASALIFFLGSRIVSADICLAATVIIALSLIFSASNGVNGIFEGLMLGAVLGIGFMIKGYAVFVFCVFPIFVAVFFNRNYLNCFNPAFFFAAVLTFFIVGMSWYMHAASQYNGMWSFFIDYNLLGIENLEFLDDIRDKWYFYTTALFLSVPAFVYAIYGMINERLYNRYSLLIFFLVPFVIFHISDQRSVLNILPMIPLLSILAVSVIMRFRSHLALFFGHIYMAALIFTPAVVSYAFNILQPYRLIFMIITLAALLVYITILGGYSSARGFFIASGWSLIILSIPLYALYPSLEAKTTSINKFVQATYSESRGVGIPVVFYETFIPSISFYRNEIVPVIMKDPDNKRFEKKTEHNKLYISDPFTAEKFFDGYNKIYLISAREHINEAEKLYNYRCIADYKGSSAVLYYCER